MSNNEAWCNVYFVCKSLRYRPKKQGFALVTCPLAVLDAVKAVVKVYKGIGVE